MISHALTIAANELSSHLQDAYGQAPPSVALGNLSEGVAGGPGGVARDMLVISVVNVMEEKTLKNVPHYVRNDVTLTARYENPPTFLNFLILVTATHANYADALLVLARAIRFFQFRNVFTQDNVAPASITTNAPPNLLDRLVEFKLIFDVYTATLDEVNNLWGTLGGRQYPFVLYSLRMLDLKFSAVQSEGGLITDVINDFFVIQCSSSGFSPIYLLRGGQALENCLAQAVLNDLRGAICVDDHPTLWLGLRQLQVSPPDSLVEGQGISIQPVPFIPARPFPVEAFLDIQVQQECQVGLHPSRGEFQQVVQLVEVCAMAIPLVSQG